MNNVLTGYVIRTGVYKEHDLIVDLLTNKGIIPVKVKASQKGNSGLQKYTNLFSKVEYIIYKRPEADHYVLTGGTVINNFNPTEDFAKYSILCLAAESILQDSNFQNGYGFFNNLFTVLSEKFNTSSIIAIILKMHLLYNGSFIESDRCVKCGSKSNIVTVSYSEGGFICDECNKTYNVDIKSVEYLKAFRLIMKAKILDANKFIIDASIEKEIINDLFNFLETNTGLSFKSRKILLDIL